MSRPNIERNKQIVALHKHDPERYSMANLARHFGLAVPTVHEIFHRDKEKWYKDELKSIVDSLGVIHS